jgi:hypothetical protein
MSLNEPKVREREHKSPSLFLGAIAKTLDPPFSWIEKNIKWNLNAV